MTEKLRPLTDEEYFEDLATPLPGHSGKDGKIKEGMKIAEVANRIPTLANLPQEDRDRLAPRTLEILNKLYGSDVVVRYLQETLPRHADDPNNYYKYLLGLQVGIENQQS